MLNDDFFKFCRFMIHLMKNYEDEKEDPQSQSKVPNAKFVLAVNKLRNRLDLKSLVVYLANQVVTNLLEFGEHQQ